MRPFSICERAAGLTRGAGTEDGRRRGTATSMWPVLSSFLVVFDSRSVNGFASVVH